MLYKDGEFYNSFILDGVTYSSVIKDGLRYGDLVEIPVEAETKAVLDFAKSKGYKLPTDIVKFDTYIKGLKDSGIWAKLDVLYLFAGDADVNFKMINLINPNKHFATPNGGLTWDKNGVKGNGTNAYIDTNYNAATNGVKFKLNNAHFGGYVFDFDASQSGIYSNPLCGVLTLDFQSLYLSNTSMHRINASNVGGSINAAFKKTVTLNRDNNNTHYALAGSGKQEQAVVSTSISSDKTTILRRRSVFSTVHLSTFHQGSALTLVENNNLNTLLENYASS